MAGTRLRRRALVGAAALTIGILTSALPATPSSAVLTRGQPQGVTCATGAITSTVVNGKTVTVNGWIRPCAGVEQPTDSFVFAIGWYSWDKTQYVGFRHTSLGFVLGPTPQTTNFSVPVDVTGSTPALCLAYQPSARLSCVNVSWVNGVLTVAPIPVADPKVSTSIVDTEPLAPGHWDARSMPCGTGAFTSATVSGKVLTLSGWIKPCSGQRTAREYDYFAIGRYTWGGSSFVGKAITPAFYAAPGTQTTTTFTKSIDFTGTTPAYCLSPTAGYRVACVDVSWVNGVAQATPIALDAPKVSVTLADIDQTEFGGRCGTCW